MKEEKYTHLIYLQFQAAITPEEEEDLENWLAQNKAHQKIKEDVLLSMNALDDFKPSFSVDLDEDYAKINSQMKIKTGMKVATLNNRRRWLGIAAAISLVILAGFGLLQNSINTKSTTEWLVLETTTNEKREVVLPDGSKIWLNEKSSLHYPNSFDHKERLVKLTGEAFFDITKKTNQTFVIDADRTIIKVLGTSFNVNAYPNKRFTTVTVKTGKVQFEQKQTSQKILLKPNQAATFNHQSKELSTKNNVLLNDLAWLNNKLAFRNTPLAEVFKVLGKHFKVKINYENAAISNCKFSMTSRTVQLTPLLEEFEQLYKLSIKKESVDEYVIRGGDCQ